MDTQINEERSFFAGIDPARISFVQEELRSGKLWGLAISGKLASGKDTVAALVMEELGADRREHLSWATPLKDELDELLELIRTQTTPDGAVSSLVERNFNTMHAQRLVLELWNEAQQGVQARSRTPRMRWGLQYLGTDVRRAEDPDYWVRKGVANCIEAVEEGRSVYFSDCRLPNEVEAARALGMYVVRLEITAEEQERRLRGRDGLTFDMGAVTHPSEVALDGYPGFDLVVDNNGPAAEAVAIITTAARARRNRF
jgi:hypothetical protein